MISTISFSSMVPGGTNLVFRLVLSTADYSTVSSSLAPFMVKDQRLRLIGLHTQNHLLYLWKYIYSKLFYYSLSQLQGALSDV
jgi:hypothetical protein